MNIIISCVGTKDNKAVAYVRFEEGERFAEGIIPDCKITTQKGFNSDEISQMEDYLRENLSTLKKEAAKINPITAMMKE